MIKGERVIKVNTPLEEGLASKGITRYVLYGASRSLSRDEAWKRVKLVMNFATRIKIKLAPEYHEVLNQKTEGGE